MPPAGPGLMSRALCVHVLKPNMCAELHVTKWHAHYYMYNGSAADYLQLYVYVRHL